MKVPSKRLVQVVALLASVTLVSACGLPRSGPNKSEIFAGSELRGGNTHVMPVDDRVNRIIAQAPTLGFSGDFLGGSLVGSDTIQPGDVLSLTIWENVEDGLLAPVGANATVLQELQVDGEGFIFVPYAGRIRASGNSPEAIRRIIFERLAEQTPDPQIEVRRLAGDGSTVSVVGAVGSQGVYTIERPTRTLGAMLAKAGGVAIRPEIAQIRIVRGGATGTIWFEDLYSNPRNDIALRAGDRILVEEDTRTFTALGATGTQSRVSFESKTISAIEAIAQVGGLSSATADPTGVFVFRNEAEAVSEQLVGRDLTGPQRVAYVLDLTSPNGVFMARDFTIRHGDTVYVTEAPFVQFNKTIAAATGSLNSATAATRLAGGS